MYTFYGICPENFRRLFSSYCYSREPNKLETASELSVFFRYQCSERRINSKESRRCPNSPGYKFRHQAASHEIQAKNERPLKAFSNFPACNLLRRLIKSPTSGDNVNRRKLLLDQIKPNMLLFIKFAKSFVLNLCLKDLYLIDSSLYDSTDTPVSTRKKPYLNRYLR